MKSSTVILVVGLGAVGVLGYFVLRSTLGSSASREGSQNNAINVRAAAGGNTVGGVLSGLGDLAGGLSNLIKPNDKVAQGERNPANLYSDLDLKL